MSKRNCTLQQTNVGPDEKSLYYNNQGLFSDPFLEDILSDLDKYENTKSIIEYWNVDEFDLNIFKSSFEKILTLWNELDKEEIKHIEEKTDYKNFNT